MVKGGGGKPKERKGVGGRFKKCHRAAENTRGTARLTTLTGRIFRKGHYLRRKEKEK